MTPDALRSDPTRRTAVLCAASRIGFGVLCMVAPRPTARFWFGRDHGSWPLSLLMVSFGARDAALGLGALLALQRGADPRPWFVAAAVSDLADTAAQAATRRKLPARGRWAGIGGAAAYFLVNLGLSLDDDLVSRNGGS